MVEIDYVVPGIVVEKKGVVDISELYSLMKEWFEKRGYYIIEKEYKDDVKETRKINIKWQANREVDDYTRFVIEVSIRGNVKEIALKKKKSFEGVVTIKFESYFEKDYEKRWENSPVSQFMRGVYDKFGLKKKFDRYSKDLREETYDVYYEVKAYLGLVKTSESS